MILPYLTVAIFLPTLVSAEYYRISKDYNEINKYLVEHLPTSEDVMANFELSNVWLQKRQDRICGLGKCIGLSLNQAIEEFHALYEVTRGREICSPQAVEILRKNKAAAGFGEYWYLPGGSGTRVSRLISAIGRQMAKECISFSMDVFDDRIKHLDPAKLNAVQQHLDLLMKPSILSVKDKPVGATEESRLKFEYGHYMIWNPTNFDELIYTSLLLARSYKPEADIENEMDKMMRFVDSFYLEPCEYYTDMLHGPLDPMLEYINIVDADLTLDKKEFYIGLGRFKWCRDLLKGSVRLVNELVYRGQDIEAKLKDQPKFSSLPAPYSS